MIALGYAPSTHVCSLTLSYIPMFSHALSCVWVGVVQQVGPQTSTLMGWDKRRLCCQPCFGRVLTMYANLLCCWISYLKAMQKQSLLDMRVSAILYTKCFPTLSIILESCDSITITPTHISYPIHVCIFLSLD